MVKLEAMWLTSARRAALIAIAAGLHLRAEEPSDFGLSARDWEGLDGDAPNNATDVVAANATNGSVSFALYASERYVVAGQYNTGTNLLAKLVDLNFRGQLRPEDQKFQRGAAYDSYFWKHTKPSNMKPGVRADIVARRAVALVMVRDPMSWLQSMKKAPYDLSVCVKRPDWLTAPCATPPMYAEYPAWLNREGYVPQPVLRLENIEAHWNEWTRDYRHMQDFGFADAVVIRYEDLVLDTEAQLARIAHVLKLPAPAYVKHIHAPAKSHGSPNSRQAAIMKLRQKPYLGLYTSAQKSAACERLDKALLEALEYTEDCL